jgi:hypothetical protein
LVCLFILCSSFIKNNYSLNFCYVVIAWIFTYISTAFLNRKQVFRLSVNFALFFIRFKNLMFRSEFPQILSPFTYIDNWFDIYCGWTDAHWGNKMHVWAMYGQSQSRVHSRSWQFSHSKDWDTKFKSLIVCLCRS